ncbi:DUF2244 domain-containing protein [Thiohalophilus thiocyanatoxydans]|uniref:Putative membrane protein n=1 Tax=Thiohalophilus thiocyanatoxydans TaxID=381308 RepID=A0A4R8IHM6_9GAMM|nr:DUF2244 domain-containing protein [Thiohalophilus thiocyanatoxydans]TDX99613.1 putative membrane protein [Thiohalophilus thiocyanatoxydans]
MVQVEHDTHWSSGCIIARPHAPSSWQVNLWFVGVAAVLCLSFAIGFALAGAWLILPFAGLEITALFCLLYYVSLKTRVQEVIRFKDNEVWVQRGRRWPTLEWYCQRFWCRLHVYSPSHPWYSSRIELRCQGRELELGQFLSDRDKRALIRNLNAFLSHG